MSRFENKTSGLLVSQDFKKAQYCILYWLLFLFLLIVSIICLFPPLWIMLSSFKDIEEYLRIPPTIIPRSFHPEKLIEIWKLLNFGKYYLNSIYLVAGELVFSITVNGLAGYVLSRLKPKGSAFIDTIVFWSMLLPTSVNMVPLFAGFVDVPLLHINITDTYLPMWLMAGANAFNILLFRSFFNGIPMSYIEAARIDGCSNLEIFGKIIIPLSKPIIIVVSIFSINAAWGSFMWPYIIMKTNSALPIVVKVFMLKLGGITTDKYMIVLLLTIIPPAVLYMFCSKNIMGGLDMSGIKG